MVADSGKLCPISTDMRPIPATVLSFKGRSSRGVVKSGSASTTPLLTVLLMIHSVAKKWAIPDRTPLEGRREPPRPRSPHPIVQVRPMLAQSGQ